MLYANQDDINLTKKLIHEEMDKVERAVDDNEIDAMVAEVLNTAYSIGGSYNEITIRNIIKSMITRNLLNIGDGC
jgi:hypothetical protein